MAKLDNKYSKTYQRIIDKAISRNFTSRNQAKIVLGYVEKHHIIPKCIGGSEEKSNLVYVTAKEHFVCHHLLTKMFDDVEIARKMRFAMNKMARKSLNQQRIRVTARIFEKMRRDFVEDMKILHSNRVRMPLTDEHKKSISISSKGHKKSEETRQKMSGPKSESQLENMRNSSAKRRGISLTEDRKKKLRKPKREGTSEVLSNLRKGQVSAYDLIEKRIKRVTKEDFERLKNIRYVGQKSKMRYENHE
jgi:hypothetical protein